MNEIIFTALALTVPTVGLLSVFYIVDGLLIITTRQGKQRKGRAA